MAKKMVLEETFIGAFGPRVVAGLLYLLRKSLPIARRIDGHRRPP